MLNDIKFNEICSYASQCAILYNNYLKLCHNNKDHEFCNELEKFRYIYEARVASLDCVGVPKTLESAKPFDSLVILLPFTIILISTFILFILYKFTDIGLLLRLQMRINDIKFNEICSYASQCAILYNNYLKLCHNNKDHEFCNELEKFRYIYEARVASLDCVGVPKTLESAKPFDSLVILLPFTIILISTFILFILYKFTDIGLLLRLQMRKRKHKSSNLGQQMNPMQQAYGTISRKSGNEMYKISYPSVGS
ncbi:PIR protein [Plasmodium vivax]|uniref:VIR protein n=1 Tax=Plasmodium vivax TaxID=5855 RepID=A0A565A7S2_PLAVI|nr:PIR protein [Plasmodium vivax]